MGKRKRNSLGFDTYDHVKDKASLVGCTIHMTGKDWGEECEPEDAETIYKLIVNKFDSLRKGSEWPDGISSAGAECVEAGTTGESGNSEPLWIKYPLPFLKFYWDARDATREEEAAAADEEAAEEDSESDAEDASGKKARKKSRLYTYLAGPHEDVIVPQGMWGAGKPKRKYTCKIKDSITGLICGSPVTIVAGRAVCVACGLSVPGQHPAGREAP